MEKLKMLNPHKYRNATQKGCDKPDIQSISPSIGVEVTSCEFNEMYVWRKYFGMPLLDVLKMEGIKPYKFSEIEPLIYGRNREVNMEEIIEAEAYLERKGKLKRIETYMDFYYLKKQDRIYFASELNWIFSLDEDYNIKTINPPGLWVGQIVEKLKQTVKNKEIKFKNYKKFNENNLYIENYSAGTEEYIEFENSTNFKNCSFDYIYISNYWNNKEPIYVIDTNKYKGG